MLWAKLHKLKLNLQAAAQSTSELDFIELVPLEWQDKASCRSHKGLNLFLKQQLLKKINNILGKYFNIFIDVLIKFYQTVPKTKFNVPL